MDKICDKGGYINDRLGEGLSHITDENNGSMFELWDATGVLMHV